MKITVCGSMTFYKEMLEIKTSLESVGHEVFLPSVALEVPADQDGENKYFGQHMEKNGGIDAYPAGHLLWDLKAQAIRDHFDKIQSAEAILVANFDKKGVRGYVGGNTLIEIGLAYYLNKKIFILNPVSSEISYKQEIMGMKPVMLDSDYLKIK